MAIKTFTTGEVLTAADTNTYLANGGLVYIKSQTVGTGVTSVNVTSAFNADYDAYRITYIGGTLNALTLIGLYMGAAAAANGYYGARPIVNVGTGAVTSATDNNVGQWQSFGVGSTTYANLIFDVIDPFAARRTQVFSPYWELNPGGSSFMGAYSGALDNTTSYTSFTLDPFGGNTMTGGTITVYGYRKA